jgi:hypothetical protein
LESSLKRLGSLGKGIQEELELQNKMLNELEEDVERGAASLDTVQAKLEYMVKRAGYVLQTICIDIAMLLLLLLLLL